MTIAGTRKAGRYVRTKSGGRSFRLRVDFDRDRIIDMDLQGCPHDVAEKIRGNLKEWARSSLGIDVLDGGVCETCLE